MKDIQFTKTQETLRSYDLLLSKNKQQHQSKIQVSADYSAVSDSFKYIAENIKRKRSASQTINLSKYRNYKQYKNITAMQVSPASVTGQETRLCIDKFVKTYVFDVLPYQILSKRVTQVNVVSVAQQSSSGIPNNTLDFSPVSEGAVKRVYNTLLANNNIPVFKFAYQERVTLESERSFDALTFVTERAIVKLQEIVHAAILGIFAAAAPTLPAAFWPGAGFYPQSDIVSVLLYLSHVYSNLTTQCRENLYVFLDNRSAAQYKAKFDVARGYWNYAQLEQLMQYLDFLKVEQHYIDLGFVASPHPLDASAGRIALLVADDSYYLALDEDITLYTDRIPSTNETIVTAEMFVAASTLQTLHQNTVATFDVTQALANI